MTDSTRPRVLVAGIGNVFLSDDAFGVEVAKRLASRVPPYVRVVDVGIRSLHLAFELAGGQFDTVILVDVVSRGGQPGTLYVIEPDQLSADVFPDAHGVRPDQLVALARTLGGRVERVRLVGCEPASLDEGMGLSEAVAGAVAEAADLVLRLAGDALPAVAS